MFFNGYRPQQIETEFPGEFGGIGSFFKGLAKTVAPIAASFIPGVGGFASAGVSALLDRTGGGAGGPAKGLAAITAYGEQVLSALRELKANPTPEAAQQAQELAASLSDPSRVYQAKKGKDAATLAAAKSQAAQLVQEVQTAAAAAAAAEAQQAQIAAMQQAQVMNGGGASAGSAPIFQQLPNGQIIQVAPAAASAVGGLDNQTLLLFGGGALLLVLLMQRR